MKFKISLFVTSLIIFALFGLFSYSVAKEVWQQVDFDITVKLQDRIPRKFDDIFSYFSLLGSAEITIGLAAFLSLWYLIRLKLLGFLGWWVIVPASIFELIGKLLIFHPAPSVFFHRTNLEQTLPSFYIQTNFSYPSGHVTRTIFLVTVFSVVIFFTVKNIYLKALMLILLIAFSLAMIITRVYLGEHWLSDTLGGLLLGLSSGLFAGILIIGKDKLALKD